MTTTSWNLPLREYRSKTLISVAPDAPLADVQRLLEERDISAVPVVSESGELLGILSTTDLLRVARIEIQRPGEQARVTPPPRFARDIMQKDVVTVDEDGTLRDAAKAMAERHIHRLIVTAHGKPVGVVSTRDAMRAVLLYRIETPLERVISTPVETVDIGDSIDTAIARLADANVRGLVVVDQDWPVGVFTHTEAIHARALPPDLRGTPVERVMSYETICLNVKTPLYRVAGHAIQMKVRRILAVKDRHLVGIVTGFDLVRTMTGD